MRPLTSPPTGSTIPRTEADRAPATAPGLVSGPGQPYFSVPVAGSTGSATVTPPVDWSRWPVIYPASPDPVRN